MCGIVSKFFVSSTKYSRVKDPPTGDVWCEWEKASCYSTKMPGITRALDNCEKPLNIMSLVFKTMR